MLQTHSWPYLFWSDVAVQQAAALGPCRRHWSPYRPQAHLGIVDLSGSGRIPVSKPASTANLQFDGNSCMGVLLVGDR
jgi:hypothetical protein